MARFLAYLEPAEEGGYIVSAPTLPGCVTQGETKAEALAMIEDAIRGYVASLRKHGESLPSGHEAGEVEVVELQVETLPRAACRHLSLTQSCASFEAPASKVTTSPVPLILLHPEGRRTVVPYHAGRDTKRGVLRAIVRQAGLRVGEFLEL